MANKHSKEMLPMNVSIKVPLVGGGDRELICLLLINSAFRYFICLVA